MCLFNSTQILFCITYLFIGKQFIMPFCSSLMPPNGGQATLHYLGAFINRTPPPFFLYFNVLVFFSSPFSLNSLPCRYMKDIGTHAQHNTTSHQHRLHIITTLSCFIVLIVCFRLLYLQCSLFISCITMSCPRS